ncbi:MAG TPA: tape measure protein, partial [Roseiflexaceae bacterium]
QNYELQVQSLQSLAARELMNTGQVTDMTAALAQGRAIGEQTIAWVQKLAIQSPFSSEDIIGAYQIGAALGFSSENLKVLIGDTTDWAAASGKGREEMMGVITALGQMSLAGHANYEQMLSLVVRGVPVWDYLAKAMHKPTAEIQQMLSKGLIPANVAIKAVSDGMHADFGGAAGRMANSLAGLTGSLKDLASISLRNLLQPALMAIQPYLAKMVDTISNPALQESIKSVGKAIGAFLVGGFQRMEQLIPLAKNVYVRLVGTFQMLAALWTLVTGPWQAGASRIASIVTAVIGVIPTIFGNAAQRARAWGYNTIGQWVAGARAAISLVVSAVKAIGAVLAEWLMPHSPPKVAPHIDQWGQQTGEQYGIGLGKADVGKHVAAFGERLRDQLQAAFAGLSAEDLGLVEQLGSTIGGVLSSLANAGALSENAAQSLQKGLQQPLVDVVRELKETGTVSEATFARLRSAAGPAGPVVERVSKAYIELTGATKKVARAQQELNDIQERYAELTRPVDAALDAIGQQRQL